MSTYYEQFKEIVNVADNWQLIRLKLSFEAYPTPRHAEDQKILEMIRDEIEIRSVEDQKSAEFFSVEHKK